MLTGIIMNKYFGDALLWSWWIGEEIPDGWEELVMPEKIKKELDDRRSKLY
jgi:hypothetical protein